MSEDPHKPLSAILREAAEAPGPRITVGELADGFGGRALGALIFVFALICILPLPPGATTVFGAPLVLLAPQLMLGRRGAWLPARIRERSLAVADLKRSLPRALHWLEKAEAVSRPRLTFLFGAAGQRLIGLVCTAFALVLVLPIPLGNMAPAAAVSVLSLALVQRDGLLALLGYALAAASVGILVLAAGVIARTLHHLIALVASA